MPTTEELKQDVRSIFTGNWTEREGTVVPEPKDVQLGNDAVVFQGAVIYADLADSTNLVQQYNPWFAASIYKAYLLCAAKLIRGEGGTITAYDGDRIMGIFIGDSRNYFATRAALKINGAVNVAINPLLAEKFPNVTYRVRHNVGVDTSKLFAARTGIRGSNDLVWVGRAANYAAKLSALNVPGYQALITFDVFTALNKDLWYGPNGKSMWDSRSWQERNMTIYVSNWHIA